MASTTYLTRTPSSAGNRKTFTFSAWIKGQTRNPAGTTGGTLFSCGTHISNGPMFIIDFLNGQNLRVEDTLADGSQPINLRTNRVFRDTNAWYHIVVAVDTTQGTSTDRVKIYVNGVQETSLSHTTYPNQNIDTSVNNTHLHVIGSRAAGLTNKYFDGCMSHVHFVDGTAYSASTFGSTDSTTGEWKINTSPTLTMGTNGFTILKDGNTITDQSSNSNNWTLAGGTLTKTEDNPSNVFATMNPLDNQNQGSTFTAGNTKLEWNTNNKNNFATLAMNAGKYYWEMKYVITTGGTNAMIGVSKLDTRQGDDWVGHDSTAWSYYASDGNKYHSGSNSAYGNSWAVDDIIGIAFDADTRTIWFSKNGTWQNSATISEIAAGTTTNAAYTNMGTAGEFFIPCMSGYDGNKAAFNFGNGYFSTTAVSSAGTNASNLGIFEYDVPTGYTALCTKGLNE